MFSLDQDAVHRFKFGRPGFSVRHITTMSWWVCPRRIRPTVKRLTFHGKGPFLAPAVRASAVSWWPSELSMIRSMTGWVSAVSVDFEYTLTARLKSFVHF